MLVTWGFRGSAPVLVTRWMSVEYHVDRAISIWGLASDLNAYKDP
jgi:hypothetical protein